MTTFFVLSLRSNSRSWSSRATSSTLSLFPRIRSDTAWPTSRTSRSISRFSSTLPTMACVRRSAVVSGSISPDVMLVIAWKKSVAYCDRMFVSNGFRQPERRRLTAYPLSAGSHATKNWTSHKHNRSCIVMIALHTRVMPRLAIARASCNGSFPSGEPSSNPGDQRIR